MPLQVNLRKPVKRTKHGRVALERAPKVQRLNPDVETTHEPDLESIDSFLEALPESTQASTVLEETDSQRAPDPATVSTPTVSSSKGKLDKIKAEHSSFPFLKRLFEPRVEKSERVNEFRELYNIQIDEAWGPILRWNEAGLPLPLMKVIKARGYSAPTPVQAQTLPVIMSGCDVVAIAPTGSGKTAAFIIPMCRHLAANIEIYKKFRGPYAVILVPTRELCIQICHELSPWMTSLGLKALGCYGGSNIAHQISQLVNNNCHVVVATPGRLIDLLAVNNGRVLSLSSVTYLVVDETDRMFDLGFGPQVRKIVETIRPDRQTVVFSATMLPAMEVLVNRILHDAVKVLIGVQSKVPSNVKQLVSKPDDKFEELLKILQQIPEGSAIVFVNTQSGADDLNFKLVKKGIKSQTLHGGMDQRDREDVITDFKKRELSVLVATSVAARGLDLKHLKLVVNYDAASHLEDYVHRAGRTGRAGETGTCVTFLEPQEKREAFQLSKCFEIQDEDIRKMAEEYAAMAEKNGNKWHGFGGHGLSRLESRWNLRKSVEQDAYGEHQDSVEPEEVLEIQQRGSVYLAHLMIDKAPKEARIAVTSAANQNEVIEKHHVSLTLKGVYASKSSKDSRLHLLIEGPSKESVSEAFHDLHRLLVAKTAGVESNEKYSAF